jgi:Holliday junction resolvase RusA-like endonuclease
MLSRVPSSRGRPKKRARRFHPSLPFPDARRRDLDNFAFKAVSDILVSLGVVSDDSDCVELSAKWITDGDDGVVRIEQI